MLIMRNTFLKHHKPCTNHQMNIIKNDVAFLSFIAPIHIYKPRLTVLINIAFINNPTINNPTIRQALAMLWSTSRISRYPDKPV